ncbi:MAG TPA: hypothetical protein VMC62_06355 [Longilinea sp.]|nr:hypothetical protein [Longilinea sp.]
MPPKDPSTSPKLEQGRLLARRLYDLKVSQLEKLTEQDRKTYLADFPLLGVTEYNDVLRQVIEAKKAEQTQVGWFSIPHDITVLVFVLCVCFTDLRTAIIAGIAVLVLLESLFQTYYNPRLYPVLGSLVWLTYPAYVLLAWVLYSRGMAWYWIAVVVIGAWGGTFLASIVARLPMQSIIRARAEASKQKAEEKSKQRPK